MLPIVVVTLPKVLANGSIVLPRGSLSPKESRIWKQSVAESTRATEIVGRFPVAGTFLNMTAFAQVIVENLS